MSSAMTQIQLGVRGAFLKGQSVEQKMLFPGIAEAEDQGTGQVNAESTPSYNERKSQMETLQTIFGALTDAKELGLPTDRGILSDAQALVAARPSSSSIAYQGGPSSAEQREMHKIEFAQLRASIPEKIESGEMTEEEASKELVAAHLQLFKDEQERKAYIKKTIAFFKSTQGGSVNSVKMYSGNSVSADLGLNDV